MTSRLNKASGLKRLEIKGIEHGLQSKCNSMKMYGWILSYLYWVESRVTRLYCLTRFRYVLVLKCRSRIWQLPMVRKSRHSISHPHYTPVTDGNNRSSHLLWLKTLHLGCHASVVSMSYPCHTGVVFSWSCYTFSEIVCVTMLDLYPCPCFLGNCTYSANSTFCILKGAKWYKM